MKKIFLVFLFSFAILCLAQSQKSSIELLYFKANLPCCKARVCNMLQTEVDSVIIKYYPDKNIKFHLVLLADEENKALIEKYKASSQSVWLVKTKKNKEIATDLTPIVSDYKKHWDKQKFEAEMKAAIEKTLKK
mgnify:CR=1 FL=1